MNIFKADGSQNLPLVLLVILIIVGLWIPVTVIPFDGPSEISFLKEIME